jgi:MFS family permease
VGDKRANESDIIIPGVARPFHPRLILLVNMVPLALALMQISSVNVGLPSIQVTLGASSAHIQWVLSGYALAFGICLVPAGRLGDLLGHCTIFTVGLGVFGLASLACGLVDDPLALNAARVFQGLGAGLQGPQTTGLIQQYFKGQARARAYATFGMVVAGSVAVGPVLTGTMLRLLGTDLGWRVPFMMNCPLALIGCATALRWLPFETERARRRARDAAKGHADQGHADQGHAATAAPRVTRPRLDLDPVGALLLTGALVCAMLPFMLHGVPPTRFWLLAGTAALGGVWFAWERLYARRGRAPMVDLGLFRLKGYIHQTTVSTLDFLGITSIFVVVALFLQQGLGWDPLHAALIGLPNAAASCVGAIWAGKYVLVKRDKVIIAALATVVTAMLATAAVVHFAATGLSPWWLMATLALHGFGQGVFGAANQTLSMLEVPVHQAGTAGGLKSMAERVSTAMGNAVMTGILFAALPALGWYAAAVTTYAVIAAVVAAALALATVYHLVHRHRPSAGSAMAR